MTLPDKKRWLITGGCGFIGLNLIDKLLQNGTTETIRVLDNLSVGKQEDLMRVAYSDRVKKKEDVVDLVVGDVRDYDVCCEVCGGIDAVVHLAALSGVPQSIANPRESYDINTTGTINMLEASRLAGVESFIFASSGAVLGDVEQQPLNEEKVARPISPYGATKLGGEGLCLSYNGSYGMKTAVLRFSNVYGPRSENKESVVAKYFKAAFDGRPLVIYGDGKQSRDFIYVDDLTDAVVSAVDKGIQGEVLQIATNRETEIGDVAIIIKKIMDGKLSKKIDIIHEGVRVGDVRRNYADISKARRMLQFNPSVRMEEGLELTYDYFESLMKE